MYRRIFTYAMAAIFALLISQCRLVDANCGSGDGSCNELTAAALFSSFLPTELSTLPVSGARLWLEAGIGTLVTDNKIFVWRDQSGNGNDALAPGGQGPTLNTNSINGNNSLTFDGLVSNFTLRENYIYATAAEGGMTIFIVCRSDDTDGTGSHTVLDFGFLSDEGYGLRYEADGGATNGFLYTSTTHGGASTTYDVTATVNDWVILAARIEFAVEQRMYVNGVSVAFDNSITITELTAATIREQPFRANSSGGPVSIGVQSKFVQNDRNFKGDMAEVIIFPAALSAANRQTMECYLGTKYGITVPHTCS